MTLGEVHADATLRGMSLRALVARGTVGNASLINDANGLTGDESIGKSFGGWYAEAGYDLAALMSKRWSLTPYARYEQLDTQRSVPAGFSRNPANAQNIFTIGVALKPILQTVIKIDYRNVTHKQQQALASAFPAGTKVARQAFFLTKAQVGEARRESGLSFDDQLVIRYMGTTGDNPAGYAYFDTHRVRTD